MAEAKIAILLEVEVKRGSGDHSDPVRMVRRFSTADGEFVAECDPYDVIGHVRQVVTDCARGRYDTHEAFTRILSIIPKHVT